jgi:hypothetical protein
MCFSCSVMSGEGIMLFSLGQVLGLLCNPAESIRKALSLPLGRPADAKESQVLGSLCNPAESIRKAFKRWLELSN